MSPIGWSAAPARLGCLCTREPANTGDAAIREAARAITDWSEVVNLASAHGVTAYVRQSSERASVALPKDPDASLRRASIGAVAYVLSLTSQLERIARHFADEQIAGVV